MVKLDFILLGIDLSKKPGIVGGSVGKWSEMCLSNWIQRRVWFGLVIDPLKEYQKMIARRCSPIDLRREIDITVSNNRRRR